MARPVCFTHRGLLACPLDARLQFSVLEYVPSKFSSGIHDLTAATISHSEAMQLPGKKSALPAASAEPRAPAAGHGQPPVTTVPSAGRGRRAPSVAAATTSGAGRGRGSTAAVKASRSRLELVLSAPSPRAVAAAGGSGGARTKPSAPARTVHVLSDMDDEEHDADGDVDFYS
jgi:hypothetical protein